MHACRRTHVDMVAALTWTILVCFFFLDLFGDPEDKLVLIVIPIKGCIDDGRAPETRSEGFKAWAEEIVPADK